MTQQAEAGAKTQQLIGQLQTDLAALRAGKSEDSNNAAPAKPPSNASGIA